MKFAIVLLAVLACGSAVPTPQVGSNGLPKTLDDDLAELIALIPTDKIIAIVINHLSDDAEVQEIAEFILSDEFEAMIVTIDAEPTFIAILNYLEAQGVEIYNFLNRLHELLGIPQIPKPSSISARSARSAQKGWRDMWNEIRAVLPLKDMYNFHCGKMADGAEWKTLYDALQGEEFRGMVNAFRVTPSWQALLVKLGEYGVRTELIVAAIQKFFNWDGDNVDYCVNYKP